METTPDPGTADWVLTAIGRPERRPSIPVRLGDVLVTGALGSIGAHARSTLADRCEDLTLTDICVDQEDRETLTMDVTDEYAVDYLTQVCRPDVILHLAGAKHAPEGEIDPFEAMTVNTVGTQNVISAAEAVGARVVMASTCKSCDPETAYGASKLIAERMVLNAGGSVVRFYNVCETSGNVFEIWSAIDSADPIPVVPNCERIFMTLREASDLLLWAATRPPGRYALGGVSRRKMTSVAIELYPDRAIDWIAPRRGDRLIEPYAARSETVEQYWDDSVVRISSPHDPLGAS